MLGTSIFAQGRNDRIKALKTAHITQALDLTPAEAEKFWPVYNANEEKMENIRRTERQEIVSKVRAGLSSMSDSDANRLIDKMIDLKSQELEHQKSLVKALRNIIPPQKILKLHKAEDDFRRMLVEKLRNHRGKQ